MAYEDPTDTRGEVARQRDDEREVKVLRDQEVADFKWLMSARQGRRIMWKLLEKAGIYRSSFTTNGALTAFKEGERNVGLVYLAMINEHCLADYVLMLKEHESNVN